MKKYICLSLILLIFTYEVSFAQSTKSSYLRLGVNSQSVKLLQQILNDLDYQISDKGSGSKGKETSYFGEATKDSIIEFQKDYGLVPDGIVGPKTAQMLDKVYEEKFASKLKKMDAEFKEEMKQAGYIEPAPLPKSLNTESQEPTIEENEVGKAKDVNEMSNEELYKTIQKSNNLSENQTEEFKNYVESNCQGKDMGCYTDKLDEIKQRGADLPSSPSADLESSSNSEVDAAAAKILGNAYQLDKMKDMPDTYGLKQQLIEENNKLADFIKKSQNKEAQTEGGKDNPESGENMRMLFASEDFKKYLDQKGEKASESEGTEKSLLDKIGEKVNDGIDAVKQGFDKIVKFFEGDSSSQEKQVAQKSLDSTQNESLDSRVEKVLNSPDYAKAFDDPKLVSEMSTYLKDPQNSTLSNSQLEQIRDGISSTCQNSIETGCFDAVKENVLEATKDDKTVEDATKTAEDWLKENNPEALEKINKEMAELEKSDMSTEDLLKKAKELADQNLKDAEEKSGEDAKKEEGGEVLERQEVDGECDESFSKCERNPKSILKIKSLSTGEIFDAEVPKSEAAKAGDRYVEKNKFTQVDKKKYAVEKLIADPKTGKLKPAPDSKVIDMDPKEDKKETGDIDFVPGVKLTPDKNGCTRDC